MYRCLYLTHLSNVSRYHHARTVTTFRSFRTVPKHKVTTYQNQLPNYHIIRRLLTTNMNEIEQLRKQLATVISDSKVSPMKIHETWKTLSSEQQQQLIAPDLLDAWTRYHANLLTVYNNPSHDDDIHQGTTLLEIIHAANQAHNVLDRMYPKWSPRRFGISTNATTQEEEEEEEKAVNKIENATALTRAQQILTLWATTSEAGHSHYSCKQLRGIPQRAQFLWQQLLHSNTTPSIEATNALLRTWVYSQEHWRGTRCQTIWEQLTNRCPPPNHETYRLMIRAWAYSGERRGAFIATGFLRKMLRLLDQGNHEMEPAIEEYRIVLKSWTTAKDQHSPEKAMSVMNLLDHALERGTTFVQFDTDCYRSILMTASRRPMLSDMGKLTDKVLKRMTEWFLVPDTTCYDCAIRTWKHEALNPNNDPSVQNQAVHRVLELLQEMDIAHNQSSAVLVRHNTSIYNHVLEAMTIDGQWLEQAEKLLRKMEQATSDEERPNEKTYSCVLRILKKSNRTDKVERAKDILNRFHENSGGSQSNTSATRERIGVLNEFIEVCASTNVESDTKGIDLLKEAINAVQTARYSYAVAPDSNSYASLLKASRSLLPSLSIRQTFAERIFDLCRDVGMVNKSVLVEFKKTVSSDLFIDIVVSSCREIEGNRAIPSEWNRNAFGGKVCSMDGSRAPPLTAEGEVIVTKDMTDFRLRRLKDKRKRNTIRGGRLPKPPKFGTLTVV